MDKVGLFMIHDSVQVSSHSRNKCLCDSSEVLIESKDSLQGIKIEVENKKKKKE